MVCSLRDGTHSSAMQRREEVAEYELASMVRRSSPLAWERLGDVFGFDVALLLAKLPGHVLFNADAACVGTICLKCCDEDLRKATARRARDKGISWPCRRCGSQYGLTKVYQTVVTRSDVVRVLFPWSGSRRRATA